MLIGILLVVGALLFSVLVTPFLTMVCAAPEQASLLRNAADWFTRVVCAIVPLGMLMIGVMLLIPLSID